MLIYSSVRLGLSPQINALATILVTSVADLIGVAGWLIARSARAGERDTQNATRSPPFRLRMLRASAAVATSSDKFSTMLRILRTCAPLLSASLPLPR